MTDSGRRFCSQACRLASNRTAPEPEHIDGARWIPLGRGLFALVDEADFEELSRNVWTACGRVGSGRKLYAHRVEWTPGEKPRYLKMHTAIVRPPAGMVADHRNGDGLDNRRHNLRVSTMKQNAQNAGPRGAHGIKGVCRSRGRWIVSIGGENLHGFATAEEAAREYDRLARERYGEFAWLNFPDEAAA